MAEEKYNPLKSPYHPLKHLAAMRHLVKDEIPPNIVHSNDPDSLFKVRCAWWLGVRTDLYNAVERNIITDHKLRQNIDQFDKTARKLKFGDDTPASRRTAEEIAWANEFIDKVLEQTGYANVLLDLSLLGPKPK